MPHNPYLASPFRTRRCPRALEPSANPVIVCVICHSPNDVRVCREESCRAHHPARDISSERRSNFLCCNGLAWCCAGCCESSRVYPSSCPTAVQRRHVTNTSFPLVEIDDVPSASVFSSHGGDVKHGSWSTPLPSGSWKCRGWNFLGNLHQAVGSQPENDFE